MNTYNYVNANPIIFYDFEGLFGEEFCDNGCNGSMIFQLICEKAVYCICRLNAGTKASCCRPDQTHCPVDCIENPNPDACIANCTADAIKECQ